MSFVSGFKIYAIKIGKLSRLTEARKHSLQEFCVCLYYIIYHRASPICGVAPVYIAKYSGENNTEIFSRDNGEESNNRPGMRNELAFAYFKVIPSCTYIITFQMQDGHKLEDITI